MMQMTKTTLLQIQRLYSAIEELDALIDFYKGSKGPAYLTCNYYKGTTANIQVASEIMIYSLEEQRARYISSLNELGIDYVVTQNA